MKLHQLSSSCRLEQIITEATRITRKTRTLLDHVYTDSRQVFQAGVIICNISDHMPVFLVLKKTRYKQQYKVIYGRSFRDFEESSFRGDIGEIDLDMVYSDDDPEGVWDRLYSKIYEIVDPHCPIKAIRIAIGKPKYLTDRTLTLMKERDYAYRIARKHNTVLWTAARNCRSSMAKEIRLARRSYILSQFGLAKGDGRKFWQVISSSFFRKITQPITEVYKVGTKEILTGGEAAKEIKFFL